MSDRLATTYDLQNEFSDTLLAEKIDRADESVEKIARENEACRRLVKMPGVGPVTATAIIATIGNGAAFRKGRDFAAWLGVVPEEHSTGGKQTLWKIPAWKPVPTQAVRARG
jgi:transposase